MRFRKSVLNNNQGHLNDRCHESPYPHLAFSRMCDVSQYGHHLILWYACRIIMNRYSSFIRINSYMNGLLAFLKIMINCFIHCICRILDVLSVDESTIFIHSSVKDSMTSLPICGWFVFILSFIIFINWQWEVHVQHRPEYRILDNILPLLLSRQHSFVDLRYKTKIFLCYFNSICTAKCLCGAVTFLLVYGCRLQTALHQTVLYLKNAHVQ